MGRLTSRRNFLQSLTACSAVFGVPAIVPASALGRGDRPAPSERILMGSIGVGGLNRNGADNQGSVLLSSSSSLSDDGRGYRRP